MNFGTSNFTQNDLENSRLFRHFGCLICGEYTGFPLGLENLENLEKWEGIFKSGKSQGILNRLEKSGKITQNTGKLREFQTNIIFYFLVIFKLTVYYFAEMHQIFSYKINF